MAASIQYSTDITWGATGAGTVSYGKILSCTRKLTAKQFEQPDEDGELHSLVLYDQREEFSLEVLAKSTQVKPAIGDIITIDSVASIIITEAEIAWKQGDTVKYNITAWKSVA